MKIAKGVLAKSFVSQEKAWRKKMGMKDKVCKLASELIKTMRSHRCKNKAWKSDDNIMVVGYKCDGCGLRVGASLVDLKRDRDNMRSFWMTIKTSHGRIALGEAFSKPNDIWNEDIGEM